MATYGFELVRNAATVDANPGRYPLTPGEAFQKGDAVTIAAGAVTKVTPATVADILGVMAETVTAAATGTTYGRVNDAAENVYRVTYTGDDPIVGKTGLKFASARTVDTSPTSTGGAIAVRAVNTEKKTIDVSFTKRLF